MTNQQTLTEEEKSLLPPACTTCGELCEFSDDGIVCRNYDCKQAREDGTDRRSVFLREIRLQAEDMLTYRFDENDVYVPHAAPVDEVEDGYWVIAHIFVRKDMEE